MFFNRQKRLSASKDLINAIRLYFNLMEEDSVSVSQIACSHPECGEAETVILVMREGAKTQAFKILKPLAEVSTSDLSDMIG